MPIEFSKYQGLGNDFILIDDRERAVPCLSVEQVVQLCDRHFGIGADGVIFLLPGQVGTDYTMRIFNADGSEPEMCGNGIRCLAQFLSQLEPMAPSELTIHTLGGVKGVQLRGDGTVTVDMGEPVYLAADIPTTLASPDDKVVSYPLVVDDRSWLVTCVNMGNPHCVIRVEDVMAIPLEVLGPQFEDNPVFPQRINTEFIQVVRPDFVKMRVWERGAGATLACGTGACAVLVAGVLNEWCDRQARIELPGGYLDIDWRVADNHVYMTGPACHVFSGVVQV